MSTRRPNAGAGANLTRPSAPGPGSSSNNTRTPTAATRPTAEMSRTMATALGRNPSTSASTSATRMGRPRAASMSTPTAAAEPMWKPLFGLEIEIFVKLRPELEHALRTQLSQGPQPSESYWRHWDLDLSNGRGSPEKKEMQRKCVGMAIMAQIELVLGPTHGWKCEPDASLKEYELKKPEAYGPPDRGKWWGIEIISPPMSAAREWRQEIHLVFGAVAQQFEVWTNTNCACHVHVSPGPLKGNKYTWDQIVRMANASFFWEEALKTILPGERKTNRYAEANATTFATAQYNAVGRDGWGRVFQEIQRGATASRQFAAARYPAGQAATESLTWFGYVMAGVPLGHPDPVEAGTRYLSSNFYPLDDLGTIELRRQAGVASAQTAIYRVLLALTLHGSALRYDFAAAASRRDDPTQKELITELAGVIKEMPKTCHGDRFVKWLNDCAEDYKAGRKEFNEHEVNRREDALHATDKPLPPVPAASSSARASGRQRAPSIAPPPSQPAATTRPAAHRQPTTAPTQMPARPRVRANSYVPPAADRPSISSSSTRYPPSAGYPSAAPPQPLPTRRPSAYNYEPAPPNPRGPGPVALPYVQMPPPPPQPSVYSSSSYVPAAPGPPRVSYPLYAPAQPPRDPRYWDSNQQRY